MIKKKYPKVAIGDLLQRANDLLTLCRRDLDVLQHYGLTDKHTVELDSLMQKSIEITTAHSCLYHESISRTSHCKSKMKEAIALRAKLVRQLRTMISIAGIDLKIPSYSKRLYKEDIVQDLNDLATACELSRDALSGAGFNFFIVNEAREVSRSFSQAITDLEVFRTVQYAAMLRKRNDILLELEQSITTICRIGRTAFASQPAYCNQYYRLR
jgi:hypothetical protein